MASNEDDDDFGQKLPPLHIYLKRVLDKYPEGGQILKELVQNADDAGARRVVVVYDKTQYSTATMWSESLQDFNGPCLYVYNDATFQKSDWNNIQHPEQSGKLDDPTKVGRFGLGFISVYHLTDIPSVLSGEQIGFLDPHEKYFEYDPYTRIKQPGKRGKKWRLSANILDQFPDQFNPYINPLFKCSRSSFEHGSFDGTIFRFPLRNSNMESQVSSAVYDDDRVRSLFQSYQADADISLLFLKNVETVELYERNDGDEDPRLLFSVGVSEEDRIKLRSKRKTFLEGVTKSEDVRFGCSIYIEKTILDVDRQSMVSHVSSSSKYLTVNLVKKQAISNDLQNLVVDQDLKLLPWVGVSMQADEDRQEPVGGRVFCFLPLPESERTGLPIHVHGYFGLGDNRRSIKWPDRESEHDKAAKWNQLLTDEAFPDAYAQLINEAIANNISPSTIYSAWPDVLNLNDHWKPGVKNFLNKVRGMPVMYTDSNGGAWMKPEDVLIQSHSDDLIRSVLLRKGYPIASAPDHVIRALEWGNIETKRVTPEVVRKAIKGDTLDWMNSEDKLRLLEYILEDKQFHDLHNIQLLPLQDGTFATFSQNAATVYIATDDIPNELFPNMSNRFIAKRARLLLADAVKYTQLRGITQQMVPSLMKEAFPGDWMQENDVVNWIPGANQQPDQVWLENIWNWLSQNSITVLLTSYSSLPLVQYNVSNGCHRLARLYTHPIIFQQKPGSTSQIPATMRSYLETLGVVVVTRTALPEFIARHPQINKVIQSPDADGVTTVLQTSGIRQVIHNVATGETNLKRDIHDFFKHEQLSSQSKTLLRQLPIFATTDNKYVSVSQVKVLVPSEYYGIPITRLRKSLILEQSIADSLAIKLGACVVSETDLVRDYILPDINTTHSNERDNIMRWVLERPQYDSVVQNVCFIPNGSGLSRPIDLFPTDDRHLKILFKGRPLFPVDEYAKGRSLSFLTRVGLRSSKSVTALEILTIAYKLTESQDREVAIELLQHVVDFPHLLSEQVLHNRIQKPLWKFLQDRAWVPCETVPPPSYPESLTWYGETTCLVKPGEAALMENADLLGSVKPLVKAVKANSISDELNSFFGWGPPDPNKYPTVEMAVKHLQNVANSFQNERDIQSMSRISDVVYRFLNESPTSYLYNILKLLNESSSVPIWHGSGFTAPEKIAISSGTFQVSLAPYLYILPFTMRPYQNFLEAVGVKHEFKRDALTDVLHIIHGKHQSEVSTTEQQTDLKLVCDILISIIAFASPDFSFADILVPCRKQQQDTKKSLKLAKSQDCLYIDDERLMDEYIRSGCDVPVVHEMVPNQTAKRLRLRPLSHCVAPVDNVNLGYDVEGPHQSTVNAIKRNLEMYKEGVDVFKELIQNADDAGASQVKFLIDWRENSQSADGLLDDGMEMCHGPALWAYNDATFNDNDVVNICSIAAASKKDKLDKIGRFGLGFTSVYHITDVPSLVSGPFILIFDPRTNHLGKRVHPASPGIKLDIRNQSHRATLRSYSNQFQPYQGIFDCDLAPSTEGFNKTLFRLPLRTEREAADTSQDYLSKAVYNSREEMTKLSNALKASAASLLLFTQNVTNVSLYSLSADGKSTDDYKQLLDISTECVKVLPARFIENQQNKSAQRKILKATKERMQDSSKPVPETTTVLKVTCKSLVTKRLGNIVQKSNDHLFVVSSCMAIGRAADLADSIEGKRAGVIPCGGIAAEIRSGKEGQVPICFDHEHNLGGAFCYLPLDLYTGLPFHINGNFLLQPNRRHLWSKASSATKVKQGGEFETNWNICLMEEVLSKALLNLLRDLQTLQANDYIDGREFQTLWPRTQQTESDFYPLVEAFYKTVANEALPIIYNGNRWVSIQDCFFIEKQLYISPIADAVKTVLSIHLLPKKWANLDSDVLTSMEQVGATRCIRENLYDRERFFREVFFTMIIKEIDIPRETRNAIMLHLLDLRIGTEKITAFDETLRELDCFPASPDGQYLTSPQQLIHPHKPIGKLYKEEDGRFPYGKAYRRDERLLSLAELGMVSDDLEWDDICERTESFAAIKTSEHSQLKQCVILLKVMDKKLQNEEEPTLRQTQRLRNARFLPVLTKSETYPMAWHESSSPFMSSSELLEGKYEYLVGSIRPVLDEKYLSPDVLSYRVRTLLDIGNQHPDVDDVTKQLQKVVDEVEPKYADAICRAIYDFLKNIAEEESKCQNYINELKEMAFILVDGKFLRCDQLAFEYRRRGKRYLYAVPDTLLTYKVLLQACGVKDVFSFEDYVKVLETLKEMYGNQPLSEMDTDIAEDMLKAIVESVTETGDKGEVLALDKNGILRPASELIYNDMSWTKAISDKICTHRSITDYEARRLGITTSRQLHLANCSSDYGFAVEFGQKEKLTTRLKGILREYSHKADVLKELLQNGDDAGATQIHVVYDPRIDNRSKIVGESWRPMHSSPALCVYNNKPFSEDDLVGIQHVGVGGKISDATTTGRFGIGFNAVYHLTDCPTFVTNNEKLCIFDPHVKYVPGATMTNPGKCYELQGDGGCLATFPDMINGYLGEYKEFDLDNGTVFRFPLRTYPTVSDISYDTYNAINVRSLLGSFESVAKESLLFLNSVQEIIISEIDPSTNKLTTCYKITAKISEEGMQYRRNLKELSNKLQENNDATVAHIEQSNFVYTMDIEDSQDNCETWLVSQMVGIDRVGEDEDDEGRFQTKAHLPRGGVAALLSVLENTDACDRSNPLQRRYKAFTVLPLQIFTELPVHVNGTFELDQSRRNLVKGTEYGNGQAGGEGHIHKWNQLLAARVIAPAYAKLIQKAGILLLDPSQENFKSEVQMKLRIYDRLFPSNLETLKGEWELVAKATLSYIGDNLLEVLPVVSVENSAPMTVTWHNAVWEASKAFFDDLPLELNETGKPSKLSHKRPTQLREFLRKIGFNLVSSNPKICKAFKEAQVNASCVTPKSVLNHLSNGDCIAHSYPCHVSDSSFENGDTLRLVLEYCLNEAEGPADLKGLPLRLTSDNMLNLFSSACGVYITRHSHVLQCLPQMFIHEDLVCLLQSWLDQEDRSKPVYSSGILKEFTLYELAQHIYKQLPAEWKGCDYHVNWTPDINGHPSEQWMKQIWTFILERCTPANNEELQSISEWPIYPTACGKLVSPLLPKTILYMDKFSDTPSRRAVAMILQKMGCPKVKVQHMSVCEISTPDDLSALLQENLSVPTEPSSVINVIRHMMVKEHATVASNLSPVECDTILRYFQEDCENGRNLSENDIKILKMLPVYHDAISGQMRHISSDSTCHTVESFDLPNHEIDVLLREGGCILLKANAMLALLYEKLQITPINTAVIYLKYVLPKFHVFSQQSKLAFIEHIRDKVIQKASKKKVEALKASKKEVEALNMLNMLNLYSALKNIAFIPDIHEVLHTTDYYYDPTKEVFANMIEPRYLLPAKFQVRLWNTFLKDIGLNHIVNQDMFIEFATQIADSAVRIRNIKDYKLLIKQARTLVGELESNVLLWNSTFFMNIASIKCIPSVPVDTKLKEIHPPHIGDNDDLTSPFISYKGSVPKHLMELTWTVAMMLPSWAIPYIPIERNIDVHKCLGIETKVTIMDKVLRHIQNVCQHMANRNAFDKTDTVSKDAREKLASVITEMMNYLKANLPKHSAEIKRRLEFTPMCPVEDGKYLVLASKVVFELDVRIEQYLKPYLFKAPRELGYCDEILRALGSQDRPTSAQLVGVLNEIHTKCEDTKMNPNETNTAHSALSCMFHLLHQERITISKCELKDTPLYFPTPTGKLKPSTSLYYVESHQMEELLLTSGKLEFTVPLKQICKTWISIDGPTESMLINLLPPDLRPLNLRKVMTEKPCPNNKECIQEEHCPFLVRIKRMIVSEEMQRVLLRLIQHQNKGKTPSDNDKKTISSLLKFQNARCVMKLRTGLYDRSGKLLIEYQESRSAFLAIAPRDSTVEDSILYLQHQENSKVQKYLFLPLAKDINNICSLVLDSEHVPILREVVECSNIDDMNGVLTHHRIPEYDTYDDQLKIDTNKVGSPVPLDIIHLLDNDPSNKFHTGEVVVYCRPIEDDEEVASATAAVGSDVDQQRMISNAAATDRDADEEYYYVYACIVGEPDDEESLTRKYKIDIGEHECIEVSVVMLYKFLRSRKATETALEVFTGDPDMEVPSPELSQSQLKDIADIKKKIRYDVKQVSDLSEKERKQYIRRLYKLWHPDKNPPQDNRLYNEAFQFLLEEIDRQKRGDTTSDYAQRYKAWEADIKREREQERTYQERQFETDSTHRSRSRRDGHNFVPPSFTHKAPDPRKARIWYRQAEAMFRQAEEQHDLCPNSPWLLAFLVYQGVEKALKAAKYYQNGKPNTDSTDLVLLVTDLSMCAEGEALLTIVTQLILLRVDFNKPLNPNSTQHRTSMQIYADFATDDALKLCKEILDIVREMVGIFDL